MRVPAGRPPGRRLAPKRVSRDGVACCPCHLYTARTNLILSTLHPKQQTKNVYTLAACIPKQHPYTA